MIVVEKLDPDGPDVLAKARVTTEDATGQERVYEIDIAAGSALAGAHLMAGSRVDDDAPDEPAGGGVSTAAFDAAREFFEAQGWEVYGGA